MPLENTSKKSEIALFPVRRTMSDHVMPNSERCELWLWRLWRSHGLWTKRLCNIRRTYPLWFLTWTRCWVDPSICDLHLELVGLSPGDFEIGTWQQKGQGREPAWFAHIGTCWWSCARDWSQIDLFVQCFRDTLIHFSLLVEKRNMAMNNLPLVRWFFPFKPSFIVGDEDCFVFGFSDGQGWQVIKRPFADKFFKATACHSHRSNRYRNWTVTKSRSWCYERWHEWMTLQASTIVNGYEPALPIWCCWHSVRRYESIAVANDVLRRFRTTMRWFSFLMMFFQLASQSCWLVSDAFETQNPHVGIRDGFKTTECHISTL